MKRIGFVMVSMKVVGREGESVCVTRPPPNLAAIFLGNAVKPFCWKGDRMWAALISYNEHRRHCLSCEPPLSRLHTIWFIRDIRKF